LTFEDFPKCVEKIQFSLKSEKNNEYFTWRCIYNYDNISLRMRNVSDENCGENQNTIFMSIIFFPKIMSFMRKCGKIWWSQTSQRWQYNMAHAHYMLDN
jgi:hypothetical protein